MAKTKDTAFGDALIQGMTEALAWKRGELNLPVREVNPMPAARIRAIRKAVAGTAKQFEEKFAVPARTLEGWEQGRRMPDLTARILLTVIERNPSAVIRALKGEPARKPAKAKPFPAKTRIRKARKQEADKPTPRHRLAA